MPTAKPIALRCKISRGGFSGECMFRLTLPDGHVYTSAAPRHYCYTSSGRTLRPDQPPPGQTIEGKVAARLLRYEGDDQALVSVPDGEVLVVPVDQISERPQGVPPDVPVQP